MIWATAPPDRAGRHCRMTRTETHRNDIFRRTKERHACDRNALVCGKGVPPSAPRRTQIEPRSGSAGQVFYLRNMRRPNHLNKRSIPTRFNFENVSRHFGRAHQIICQPLFLFSSSKRNGSFDIALSMEKNKKQQ